MLEQQFINALSLGSVYALFALGFTLVFGVLGVIHLAHGAVFMLGAYAALALATRFSLPLWAALPGAALACGALGLAVDALVLRPLRRRGAPHLVPMIATIGLGMLFTDAAQAVFGTENLRFPADLVPDQPLRIGPVQFSVLELGIVAASVALMAALFWLLARTRTGRALRAVAESPKAAALLGIHVEGLFLATSFAAAALGGACGVLIGLYSNAVYPAMGQQILHKGIAAIILGGMGDIRGALLGGFFLGFAEVFSVAWVGSEARDAVAFGLLFLVLLLRPQGLFGQAPERKA